MSTYISYVVYIRVELTLWHTSMYFLNDLELISNYQTSSSKPNSISCSSDENYSAIDINIGQWGRTVEFVLPDINEGRRGDHIRSEVVNHIGLQ